MNPSNFTRGGTLLVAGALFFAAASTRASAVPTTFDVTTTIAASCVLTGDPVGNLTPTYVPSTDTGTGSESVLSTNCNGEGPTVAFTDAGDTGTTAFEMSDGPSTLIYQISNTPTCTGVAGDGPIQEGAQIALTPGASTFDICAAVTTGGVNVAAPAGAYGDTVTYTITP